MRNAPRQNLFSPPGDPRGVPLRVRRWPDLPVRMHRRNDEAGPKGERHGWRESGTDEGFGLAMGSSWQACCSRGRLLDQGALVQMQGMRGVLGGLRIMGDHHDGLAVLAI